MKEPKLPENILRNYYITQRLAPAKIAQRKGVSSDTVYHCLKKYNIPLRVSVLKSRANLNLTEVDKAYLAGYLDGDGTICMGISKHKQAKRGLLPHPEVSLFTKSEVFANQLNEIFGGQLSTSIYHDSRGKKNGYKVSFTRYTSKLAVLEAILPYLRLKTRQAKLMIEFIKERLEVLKYGYCAPISDKCWNIIYELRGLNK